MFTSAETCNPPRSQIDTAVSNDAFMASTVRIPSGDVARFLDELHDCVLMSEDEAAQASPE